MGTWEIVLRPQYELRERRQTADRLRSKSRSNTSVTPRLRPYCDKLFDQIALNRRKVSLRSHYGLSVVCDLSHKSLYGRTSRFSRSAEFWNVQNSLLRLFDRSALGLLSVCARAARTVVAVRSPKFPTRLSIVTLH